MPIKQFSWKWHICGKRGNSLLFGINFHWQKFMQASVSSKKSFKFAFLKFKCNFPFMMAILAFLLYIVIQMVLCVVLGFTEDKLFREISPWRETGFSAYWMKSYEKLCVCKNRVIFWEKNVYALIERYFSSFVHWFEIFSNRW